MNLHAPLRRAAWLALTGLSIALAGCFGSDDEDPKTYSATVRYTSYGVPHVKADNFKGAGYGYGYAFAKDNVCTFAEVLVTLHGERAQHFGEAGGYLGSWATSGATSTPTSSTACCSRPRWPNA